MEIEQIVRTLQQNDVIAYPTEAVFGLGCNPYSESAVQKLLQLKQRPIEKGLIVIAPNLEYLRDFIDERRMSAQDWQRLQQVSAKPITWVVPARAETPRFLTGQFDSIALRLCSHPAVAQLCRASGFALTSTSANLSGQPPCMTTQQVRQQFGEYFPVLDGAVGDAARPSEIRDLRTGQLFRQG